MFQAVQICAFKNQQTLKLFDSSGVVGHQKYSSYPYVALYIIGQEMSYAFVQGQIDMTCPKLITEHNQSYFMVTWNYSTAETRFQPLHSN